MLIVLRKRVSLLLVVRPGYSVELTFVVWVYKATDKLLRLRYKDYSIWAQHVIHSCAIWQSYLFCNLVKDVGCRHWRGGVVSCDVIYSRQVSVRSAKLPYSVAIFIIGLISLAFFFFLGGIHCDRVGRSMLSCAVTRTAL